MKIKPVGWNGKSWTYSDWMTLAGLIVALVGLVVAIATPEIRCLAHLKSETCSSIFRTVYQEAHHSFQGLLSYVKHHNFVKYIDLHHIASNIGCKLAKLRSGDILHIQGSCLPHQHSNL